MLESTNDACIGSRKSLIISITCFRAAVITYISIPTSCARQLAAMEKTKMVVFNGGEAEEPLTCSGYPWRLEGLEAKFVLLDDIMASSEAPDRHASRHTMDFVFSPPSLSKGLSTPEWTIYARAGILDSCRI